MHTMQVSSFRISESGRTLLPSIHPAHTSPPSTSSVCMPILITNPDRHPHFLQSPFNGVLPTRLNTPPCLRLPPPLLDLLNSFSIRNIHCFQYCLSTRHNSHAEVQKPDGGIDAYKQSRPGCQWNDIAKADGLNGNQSKIKAVDEGEFDKQGVNQRSKADITEQNHNDDDQSSLFAAEATS